MVWRVPSGTKYRQNIPSLTGRRMRTGYAFLSDLSPRPPLHRRGGDGALPDGSKVITSPPSPVERGWGRGRRGFGVIHICLKCEKSRSAAQYATPLQFNG